MVEKTKRRHLPVWLELLLLAAALAVVVLLLRAGYHRYMRSAYPLAYTELVEQYAAQNQLEPSLVYAVIRTESDFRPDAVSSAGARGLMQLTEDTFDWAQYRSPKEETLTADQLFDPAVNIEYGCLVLALLKQQFPNERTALAAYNAGIGTVRKWLKTPNCSSDGQALDAIPYPETARYVEKIARAQDMYRMLYGLV